MSTENTTISSKQIMFVVWKWNDLTAVNEKAGEKSKLEKYLSEIKSNNSGSFFKEHEVETSDLCPNPLLVASYIYKTEVTRNLLYALLDKYAINNNEVMVFLHRGDFYDEDDVNHLLGEFGDRVAKCFLFADGRDYIYHKTQKSGFLDDAGGFKISRDRETGEQTCTYENSKVKQPYFDRVWEYYEIEFEIKVFQLKEELLDRWLLFLMPDQPDQINRKALIHAIQEQDDRLLWLRIKSFTDRFQVKELDEVKDFEQIDVLKPSFLFLIWSVV